MAKKNVIIVFLLSFIFLKCENQEYSIKYYPSKKLFNSYNLVNLNIDSLKNFKQITNEVRLLQQDHKRSFIEIKDKGFKKIIFPYVYDGSFIKKRNILNITYDSILIDKGYSITELKKILTRHYINNGKDYHYPESFKKAGIEVSMDTISTSKELRKTLFYLTKVFDEVNEEISDTLELKIFFSYFRQIPPPPKTILN